MAILWRVEGMDGYGPYQSYVDGISFAKSDKHPTPEADGLGYMDIRERCAFESLVKLFDWFYTDEILSVLEAGGMSVVKIEVPDEFVKHGGKQSLFVEEDWPRVRYTWAEARTQLETQLALPTI